MSDYIKREDAINKLADEYVFDARSEYEGTFTRADFIDDAKETLADIPNADVVEVVRCKDCKYNDQCKHRVVMWVEDPINTWHKDIDFCSYGKRKDDE